MKKYFVILRKIISCNLLFLFSKKSTLFWNYCVLALMLPRKVTNKNDKDREDLYNILFLTGRGFISIKDFLKTVDALGPVEFLPNFLNSSLKKLEHCFSFEEKYYFRKITENYLNKDEAKKIIRQIHNLT